MRAAKARREDRGAAAVEFALIMPVLMLLVFGIIDFGRMLNAQIKLTEAAREGARAGSLIDQAAGEARIQTAADGLGTVVGTVTACPVPPGPDDDVIATATHEFSFVTPVGIFIGSAGTITLTATGVMPCLT